MKEKLRFLGLDVHAETIAVAVAEPDGEVRSLGTIPNCTESIRKLIKKLGPADKLKACYEAGPTGYVVYWKLAELGIECEVVAPTLVPVKAGDRVKTDRRDAEKLARCYRSGDLTAVWVPDEGSEALRDLVRAREAAKQDQTRARHRLSKFLLRSGQRPPSGVRSWTRPYLIWVAQLRFPQIAQEFTRQDYLHEVEHMRERVARLEQAITEAVKLASPELQQVINDLQALRGIADISAVTIAAELGQVSRFNSARQLMGYCGVVPSEDSSGKRTRRGSITRASRSRCFLTRSPSLACPLAELTERPARQGNAVLRLGAELPKKDLITHAMHSDNERIKESALYDFVKYEYSVVDVSLRPIAILRPFS
jgi:transposase